MARHFLQLYVLIVATLAAVSWSQERLWDLYERRNMASTVGENAPQTALLSVVESQLRKLPREQRPQFVADIANRTHVDLELLDLEEIAGSDALERLRQGEVVWMSGAGGEAWLMKGLRDDDRALLFRYTPTDAQRGLLEWILSLSFFAAIALVLMIWLWPLTRDLQRLERSTLSFGNANWTFDAPITSRSQVYSLAQAFRRMAQRIESLISSHKDMSNAVAHEIKTPLARMRFEIEMARAAATPALLTEHLNNINTDIVELNSFVTAALDYAILERAEVTLNIAEHDFTLILPAVTESVRRGAPSQLRILCEVDSNATRVSCDAHLIETVLKNLVYNATRYARKQIRVAFRMLPQGIYSLRVDDDGPGIAEADRQRVFGSFVQLGEPSGGKVGYGLGLAIVKRIVDWHGGDVAVSSSDLGGAGFHVQWPAAQANRDRL
jgi:two-component system, OmpR family, sensor kinase